VYGEILPAVLVHNTSASLVSVSSQALGCCLCFENKSGCFDFNSNI
jgi:pyruvoyl-dependent arginine decarboxylase (PvlArgDC)